MPRFGGGGPKYEAQANQAPEPEELLGESRRQRVEAVVAMRTRNLVVVLDRLEDTFNMGGVLRTCEGMGLQEVHLIENPQVPFRPNLKVTQGCEKWLDLHHYKSFAECRAALKARGFRLLVSAVAEGAKSLFDVSFEGKVALVFGNERFGVSKDVLEGADETFWVPMRGFVKSLNISAAASASITRAVAFRQERLGVQGDLLPDEAKALRERFMYLAVSQRGRVYPDGQPG